MGPLLEGHHSLGLSPSAPIASLSFADWRLPPTITPLCYRCMSGFLSATSGPVADLCLGADWVCLRVSKTVVIGVVLKPRRNGMQGSDRWQQKQLRGRDRRSHSEAPSYPLSCTVVWKCNCGGWTRTFAAAWRTIQNTGNKGFRRMTPTPPGYRHPRPTYRWSDRWEPLLCMLRAAGPSSQPGQTHRSQQTDCPPCPANWLPHATHHGACSRSVPVMAETPERKSDVVLSELRMAQLVLPRQELACGDPHRARKKYEPR